MTVEEMIKNSQCFGIAYDARVPECKTCDVKTKCDAKCRSTWDLITSRPAPTVVAEVAEITSKIETELKPETKHQVQSNKSIPKVKKKVEQPIKTVKAVSSAKNYSEDMPEFKNLTIEQLEKMAVERGIDLADFDKFKANNIRRMRLTMALKKTYEV